MVEQAITAAPHMRGAVNAMGGPKGMLGRAFGMGPDEMEVGVPWWAWLLIGGAAGGIAVWLTRERLERIAERVTQ
jgi:hypothetical protein